MRIPGLYFAIAVVAAILLSVYLAIKAERRRREQLREQAARLGYIFEEERRLESEPFRQLRLFGRGRTRRLNNVLSRKTDGTEILILEFSYRQGSGKQSHHYTVTVFLKRTPHAFIPGFELRPEGITSKIASLFGYQDIDFSEDPEFSSKYLLRGENEERIREIFTMPVRLQLRERTKWSVEGEGEWLAAHRGTERVKPDDLGGFIREAEQIVEMIARTLVH